MSARTPDLATIIRRAIDASARNLHVCLPGIVTRWDAATQVCDVQPILKDTPEGGDAEDMPQLVNVPMAFYRTDYTVIYSRIEVGTRVIVYFTDKSLDLFLESSGTNTLDPQDTRSHDLSDGFAVPGLYPETDPIPNFDNSDCRIVHTNRDGSTSEIFLGGDTNDIVLLPSDTVQLGNQNMSTDKGVARLNDGTEVNSTTDAAWFTWLSGFVTILTSWTVAPTDGGLALQTAMIAYIAANPVPSTITGAIIEASETVMAED